MRKPPVTHRDVAHSKLRATFEVDRDLADAFRAVAHTHDRTLSSHIRYLMKLEVAKAAQEGWESAGWKVDPSRSWKVQK